MRVEYILAVIFAVLTVAFRNGKGGWLIAGYNTMSDENKEKYDRKKLCRLMGCCTGIIDIFLIISCFIGEAEAARLENIFAILVLVVVGVTIILANTICRK